jgi:hypothetical protein
LENSGHPTLPDSSLFGPPSEFCLFGAFKVLYKKEKKMEKMKVETLKMYRAMSAFYKATVIQVVRWSSNTAASQLNLNECVAPLTVNPQDVLERITRPECTLEALSIS